MKVCGLRGRIIRSLAAGLLWPALLAASSQSGAVRAADQPVPGATVTAQQGGAKVVAYTDETGRYTLDLTPGDWDVQVEMFGFAPARARITVGSEPGFQKWTLDMPRYGEAPAAAPGAASKAAPAPTAAATPATTAAKTAAPAARRSQANGQRPGYQDARVTATAEGAQALAVAGQSPATPLEGESADEAFLVSGSSSGGLAASSDEESRRQRMMQDRAGGPGGTGSVGLPPGMRNENGDILGLGGLGASAINAGFGDGAGGGPGVGFGGRGGGGGGFGGPGGGGGGGGRGGGGYAGRGDNRDANRRGPFNGQYASFGNRRRQQNALTGSLFTSLNNSALNAAPFSLNGQAAQKPSYAQSRFGVNLGGPLVIPKLLNLPRASFYFTYQGSHSRNPYSSLSSVPTAAERGGDFSQAKANTSIAIYDPLSGLPFANNVIPQSRFDSAASGLLKYIPSPTYSGTVQNYQLVTSYPNTSDNYGGRLNLPLSRKDRLNFNLQFQTRHSKSQQLFGFRDTGTGGGNSISLGWSHSFAPRFNNSASVSLSRNNNTNLPYFANTENVAEELGISGVSQIPINYGPPNLSFTNFGALSDGSASVSRNQTVSFTDSVTYVIQRKHNLTFGFGYRRMQQNSLTYQNARGAFTFSGLLTSQLNASGNPISGTGFDFADFLLGLPQSSSLRYGADNNYFRGWSLNSFAQDDFRITRKLSLNFGLRYEFFSPYTELRNHLANLDVAPGFTAVSVVTPGAAGPYSGNLPASLVRSDPDNFSPRFGFAYRPTQKHGIVIRGGYSIFYSGASYSGIASQMASQPPFASTISTTTSSTYPLTLKNGFYSIPTQTITNTYAIDPNYRIANAQTWNIAVQNAFPHGFFVELEYIGTKGTDLSYVMQPNQAVSGSLLTAQQNLKIANASGFSYQTDGANSNFNAAQVRVTRRFTRGMGATALYAFSKAIDDASNFNGTGGTVVQYIDNLRLERGPSSFDQRHRLSTTYMLSSPVGVHGWMRNGGWKTTLLTGWALSGGFNVTSGAPMTARVSGNLSNTGGTAAFGSGRAQATGLSIHSGAYPYFNLLAFTTPQSGQYGNAGRNTIPGLFQVSTNAALNRSFRLGDTRRQLQLRLSANNALNHVTITSIGTTVNSSTYGLATGASATRTVTLLLRFNF